jgi:hypothetical protein
VRAESWPGLRMELIGVVCSSGTGVSLIPTVIWAGSSVLWTCAPALKNRSESYTHPQRHDHLSHLDKLRHRKHPSITILYQNLNILFLHQLVYGVWSEGTPPLPYPLGILTSNSDGEWCSCIAAREALDAIFRMVHARPKQHCRGS